MKIKLNWIEVQNFKRLKNFRAEFKGKSALVAGKNSTGKTTLADAFFWLMTDADSEQQTKFNLLELQKTGDVIDNQDAVVEAEFMVGVKKVRLRKEYKQKWQTKRGSTEAEMTTHTTDHFFDGVPVKKKEWAKKLGDIIDPDIIRSIADIHYFCSRLKPERRREILMEIAGKISDRDICNELGADELAEMLDGKTPDDVKKILSREIKEIKKALDDLPGRIDELNKMIPDTGDHLEQEVLTGIKEIDAAIEEKKREILATRSGLSISEKEREVNELKIEATKITAAVHDEINDRQHDLLEKIDVIKRDRERLQGELRECYGLISYNERMVEDYTIEKSRLIEKWQDISDQKFTPSKTCFACGQILSDDVITNQLDEFNLKKSNDLTPVDERGRWLSGEIQRMNEEIIAKKLDAKRIDKDLAGKSDVISDLENQVKAVESEKQTLINSRTKALTDRITQISNDIKQEMEDIAPAIEKLESEIAGLDRERNKLDELKLDFAQTDRCRRSIEKLRKRQKDYGAAHEEVERKMNMLAEFSRWKSTYIEQHVNDKFELVRWKLFEFFQSGGEKEICEATFDGVPYSTDLNTGSKINLGLDVIRTLQKHYDMVLPIWIDNAEAVTNWMIDIDDQVIKLAASPNIEKLEVIE